MDFQIIDITPQMAAEFLSKNTFNRNVSSVAVRKYAADMKNGKWRLNHQGIAFDENGVLVDGQHRLLAIIQAAKTIRMPVVRGSDRVGIDELRVRSTADVIKFGGLSDWITNKDIQVAKAMVAISSGGRTTSLSTSEIVVFANAHRSAIEATNKLFATNTRGISLAVVKGAFCIAICCNGISESDAESFVGCLYTGIGHEERCATVQRLRQFLLFDAKSYGGQEAQRNIAAMTMQAIKNFSENRNVTRLIRPKSMPFTLSWDFKS